MSDFNMILYIIAETTFYISWMNEDETAANASEKFVVR